MRSTLRRNAMTTPASVHCVSRQLMFSDLSRTGCSGGSFGNLGTIASSPSTSSRMGSCVPPGTSGSRAPPGTSGFCAPPGASGFSCLTGSDPAGNPPILNLQTMASHQSFFSWFHVNVVHVVFFVRNCTTSAIFFATFEPVWNKKPLSPCNTVTPPFVVYSPTDNSGLHTGA